MHLNLNELLSRTSMFQRELDDREKTKFDVLEKVFTTIYWLSKENVANTKTVSHLQLLEQLGLAELHHVQHRSPVSLREIYLTIGETIQMQICDEVPNELYGLLVDDVADICDCSFVHAAATVWNALPVTVTSKDSLLTFKAALKTHLCALAYM